MVKGLMIAVGAITLSVAMGLAFSEHKSDAERVLASPTVENEAPKAPLACPVTGALSNKVDDASQHEDLISADGCCKAGKAVQEKSNVACPPGADTCEHGSPSP